jgi:hypothetical protein
VDSDRVGRINPRAGLGLVEPGHFVAIVVDGRFPYFSHGVLLSNFAQMFLDEGCVMAYNLDGGASATMVFMGEYINRRPENHYRSVRISLLWGYSELVPTRTIRMCTRGSCRRTGAEPETGPANRLGSAGRADKSNSGKEDVYADHGAPRHAY